MNSIWKYGAALVGFAAMCTAGVPLAHGQVDQAYYGQEGQLQDSFDTALTNYSYNCESGSCNCEYGYSDCGCCDTGYCDCDSGGMGNMMGGARSKQFFGGVDYIYARANFSESVAFVVEDNADAFNTIDTFQELEFQPGHSYRAYAGWRDVCCGTDFRFQYTRLQSDAPGVDTASQSTDPGVVIAFPLEPALGPENSIRVFGSVDLQDYDLGCAKTIPLGSPLCCDSTGCADTCTPCCPAWDITWEGGVRYSDVNWSRDVVSTFTPTTAIPTGNDSTAFSRMDFQGVGLRMGLGGRRYFGKQGCFSVFMNGDLSVLVGDMELVSRRTLSLNPQSTPPTPDQVTSQVYKMRNIVPVTELEAGVTGQLTNNVSFSGGYMLSAWHDLGMRAESFPTAAQGSLGVTTHDDANILGWDGIFARLEGQF